MLSLCNFYICICALPTVIVLLYYYMDNKPGISAVRNLPVRQRSDHAAFIHCVILSLCQLLNLNDNNDASISIRFIHSCASALDQGYSVRTLFLDFKKTFDLVDITID